MKKCSVITGMILASLLLFMNSCEKDYLNAEEISYSLTVSDTVYLNEPVTIKGVINQDLDIRVYWENWNNDHLIGVLKPYRDSIVWIPENIKEGPANLLTQIAYKSGRKNQTNLMGGKNKPRYRNAFSGHTVQFLFRRQPERSHILSFLPDNAPHVAVPILQASGPHTSSGRYRISSPSRFAFSPYNRIPVTKALTYPSLFFSSLYFRL